MSFKDRSEEFDWADVFLDVTVKQKGSEYTRNIKLACSDLWRRMFVWWDGKINPCDVDYKSELSSGDIKNHNISELWKSDNYLLIMR